LREVDLIGAYRLTGVRWEEEHRKEADMYRHIVVALDGSHCADRALDQAMALAKLSDARLTLLHIANLRDLAVENVQLFDNSRLHEMARARADAILDEAEARVRAHGVSEVERFVGESWDGGHEMARALVGFATEHAADLILSELLLVFSVALREYSYAGGGYRWRQGVEFKSQGCDFDSLSQPGRQACRTDIADLPERGREGRWRWEILV
jgi:nucleotide-binding universal stress UspA family protein